MPRGIKPAEPVELVIALTLSNVAQDPYPKSPQLRKRLVKALLGGIEARDPDYAKFCRTTSHWIAALENHSPTAFGTQITTLLNFIRYPKRFKGDSHDRGVLGLQRAVLAFYLDAKPYGNFKDLEERWSWVSEHGPLILKAFAMLPCQCNYETSIDENDHALVDTCKTPGELVHLLLAHLHCISPETIKDLLKPHKN